MTAIVVGLCVLAGCNRSEEKAQTQGDGSAPVAAAEKDAAKKLSAADVVVEVAGERLTYGELETLVALQFKPKKNKNLLALMEPSDEEKRLTIMKRRVKGYPGSRLLVREAKKRGLRYDPQGFEKFRARYAKHPEDQRRLAEALIQEDLTIAALRADIFSVTKVKDDATIQKCLKKIERYNARAVATNTTTLANLKTLKGRLEKGEITFGDAVRKYSEDEWADEGTGEWGSFNLASMEGEDDILKVLPHMKKGEIAGPLEGDNGYMLLRFDGREDDQYALSRIFRRQMMMMDRETADELRARFRQEDADKALNELAERLLKENPPTYPHGLGFLERKRPKRAFKNTKNTQPTPTKKESK